jgi:hypothetical protein
MLPPDEQTGLAAVKTVQSLSGPELEKRVRAEVGDPMLAFFSLLAKSVAPEEDDHAIAKRVHLMILAYLIRGELQSAKPAAPKPKAPPPKKK